MIGHCTIIKSLTWYVWKYVYIYLKILFLDLNFTPTEETHITLNINH